MMRYNSGKKEREDSTKKEEYGLSTRREVPSTEMFAKTTSVNMKEFDTIFSTGTKSNKSNNTNSSRSNKTNKSTNGSNNDFLNNQYHSIIKVALWLIENGCPTSGQ